MSGVSELCSVPPPEPMTRQREYAPGSVVQANAGLALDVGKAGRAVMTGAGGATVLTSNPRVASAPRAPGPVTCDTANV